MKTQGISIWFIIGMLLTIYGLLITAAGIYQAIVPPEKTLVLAELHAGIWWGAVMLVLGLFYLARFRPAKHRDLR